MPPSIVTIGEGSWAAAQYMLQGATFPTEEAGRLFYAAPTVQIGRTGKEVINCLDEEFDAVWMLPEFIPRDLALHHLLPLGPTTLLPHCYSSPHPLIFHCRSDLLLDQLSPLSSLCFVKPGDFQAPKPSFSPALYGTTAPWLPPLQPLLSTFLLFSLPPLLRQPSGLKISGIAAPLLVATP